MTDVPVDREVGLTANIPPWDPQPDEGHWGRILDPVRAAALKRAIAAVPYSEDGHAVSVEEIITVAKRFEAYLAGEETP